GRARLEHVGDEDRVAREPDLFQQLVQQLPGAADERQPLAVLFGPRRLADEHQLGVGVAGPEDGLGPGLVQGALGAAGDLLVEGYQLLAALLGRGAHFAPFFFGGCGFSPRARFWRDSTIRSLRAASRSPRIDSFERTLAPRGCRPGGETLDISRRVRPELHSAQATASAPADTSSSKRAPHPSHSNS